MWLSLDSRAELDLRSTKRLLSQSDSCALSIRKLPEEVRELVLQPCLAQHHEEGLQGLDRDGAVPALTVAVDHQRCGQRRLGAGRHIQDGRVVGSNLRKEKIKNKNKIIFDEK